MAHGTVDEYYGNLISLLPYELSQEGRATKLKKLLKVYSNISGIGDHLIGEYRDMLDISKATKKALDLIGGNYAVFRKIGESDDDYRVRIIGETIHRKSPTTIPEIQQSIDAVVNDGKIYVLENHRGTPANIYITGTAGQDSTMNALGIAKTLAPAGVRVLIPVVSFDIWQNVRDQFNTWGSLMEENFIW